MYTIVKTSDGRFHCQCRLQDGTERWDKPTLAEAIESMKRFARSMNNDRIGKRQITYLREENVTRVECVPWKPK